VEDEASAAIGEAFQRWYDVSIRQAPRECVAAPEDEGMRLPKLAAATFPELGSKSQAEQAVKKGLLRLNGEVVETSRIVRADDVLALEFEPPKALKPDKLRARLRFIEHLSEQAMQVWWEDDDLAVVYKPAGVHTKSKSNYKYAAFEDALPAVVAPPRDQPDRLALPLAMHRLDVPVSGLVLVAKTRTGALGISAQFMERAVKKVYTALLVGSLPDGLSRVDTPVDGDDALTEVTLLEDTPHPNWGWLSKVELSPLTGRTHQLRIHAASLGCPIVGDDLYWEAGRTARQRLGVAAPLPPVRSKGALLLQATGVSLRHPRSGAPLSVASPPHAKFSSLWERAQGAVQYEREHGSAGDST